MNFKDFFANPAVKTATTLVVGAVAAAADAAVQGGPTGDTATYLAAHPNVALAFIIAQQLAHNFLSKYAPPTTVVTKTP